MKKQVFALGLLTFSALYFAQEKGTDSLNIRTIEDVKLHKTGNPNKAKTFTTKSNLDVMENPQAVSIVTHEIIEQQQAQQLSDVLKNVNGVYITSSRGNSQDTFGARGYTFGSENIYKNGSRVNSGAYPEVSGLERVEVLKGGAALLYGNIAPGGIVNMITKKPLFKFGGSVGINGGSWNNFKPTVDIYDKLTNNMAFRINGSYENKESFRDVVKSEKFYFNPSFLYNISDKTQLIVEGDFLRNDFTPDFGIGSLIDPATGISKINTITDKKAFFGADWQYQNVDVATTTVTLNHKINDRWNYNAVASYQNYTRDYFSTERVQWNLNNGTYLYSRSLNKTYGEQNYGSVQLNLNGEFTTGKIKHKVLFGGDADYLQADSYTYYLQKQDNSWSSGTVPYGTNGSNINNGNINLYDQSTWGSGYTPNSEKRDLTRTPTRRVGFYVQDLISITEKLKVLAGVRWSYIENMAPLKTNYTFGSTPYNKIETTGINSKQAFSPRAGLVYQWNPDFMTFASYSNSFTPNTGQTTDGKSLDPSTINQYEIGFKKNLFNNAVAFNVTAYQIDNSNLSQPDPANLSFRILAGKTRSQGAEVDITGNPLQNLSLIAGYAYLNMIYKDTPESKGSYVEGERLVGTPRHTANLSAFYTFTNVLKGLRIGATGNYIGDRNTGWNNTKDQAQVNRLIPIDGYTTFDFSIGYQYERFTIMGKMGNAFDTLNYNVHENYSVNPIMPRNYYVTLTYKL